MGIGQFLTMPIFFASNAIYPVDLMSGWLRAIVRFNPLTYVVDGLRGQMLATGQHSFSLLVDYAVPGTLFIFLVMFATRMYPRLTE